jgi:hypothetical protein
LHVLTWFEVVWRMKSACSTWIRPTYVVIRGTKRDQRNHRKLRSHPDITSKTGKNLQERDGPRLGETTTLRRRERSFHRRGGATAARVRPIRRQS